MKKKLAHWFRQAVAILARPWVCVALAAVCAAVAPAQPPAEKGPELKLPEAFQPRVVKNAVKATATVDANLKLINIEDAWKKTKGEGVILYVADTGVDLLHPEFKGAKLTAVNFTTDRDAGDINGHGTFCTSEIIGRQNVDGVAPNVDRTVHLKVLANSGAGDLDWVTKAIRYAIKDANGKPAVFSASLVATPMRGTDNPDTNPELQAAILDGWQAGIVFCFAAGNDNSKLPPNSVGWPARYGSLSKFDGLCVVAACDLNRKITDFSSVGPATWTTAVGHDVLGALPDGKYGRWDGTSMATPIVAGVACLWLSANQSVPPAERYRRFADEMRQASSFPNQRHPARGWGLVDAGKLLDSSGPTQPPKERPFVVTITLDDLSADKRAELRAGGVNTFRLEVGHGHRPGTGTQVVPVQQPAPAPVPVQGYWPGQVVQPVYQPAPPFPLPQVMPGGCVGGVCPQPVQQWYPGQRVVRLFR